MTTVLSSPPRKILTGLAQFHAYEGYPLDTVVYPIRLMAALGVQDVISASYIFTDFSLFNTDRRGGSHECSGVVES